MGDCDLFDLSEGYYSRGQGRVRKCQVAQEISRLESDATSTEDRRLGIGDFPSCGSYLST